MEVTFKDVQLDIVIKGLFLMAKENQLELSERTHEILSRVAENGGFDSDITDVIDILDYLANVVASSEYYDFNEEESD